MHLELNMYQTLAIAVLVLILGKFLPSKNQFSGKILYPGTGCRRSDLCDHDLCTVWSGNRRTFL